MGYEESQPRLDLNLLPVGTEPMGGQKATDAISKTLAAVSPGQMQDVMAGMKVSFGSFTYLLHDLALYRSRRC